MVPRRRLLFCAITLLVAATAAVWPSAASAGSYPNDEFFGRQWHLRRIGAQAAWQVSKGKGITIAVLDTGVDRRHLDLAANMSPLQYDAVNGTSDGSEICTYDPPVKARVCHGTSVAGVAAAVTNNKRGVAGVAPDAKIMAIRVSTKDNIDDTAVLNGMMWAVDHGAKVINMSITAELATGLPYARTLPVPDPWNLGVLYAAARGALITISAGNDNSALCGDPGENPAVLCVGASDSTDQTTFFSNYGVRLDVVAPGLGIWTTSVSSPYDTAGYYSPLAGTSFAAPLVAGIGAQLMSMGATNIEAANIIRGTAKDLGLPGYDITYGFGRVDANAAVHLCQQVCRGMPLG